ncbi:MAG: O-antigen ligase family protein, partial [Hyphomicrobiales bacterium]|nr:O-antigen ligase family protein [Hyphomicrobiales bacterium]
RSLLLFFITGITMGVAVGTTDLRRLHTAFFFFLVAVALINLGGAVVVPSIAITDIGIRGLYTQKNVAGVVAMITIIMGATWIIGATRPRDVILGLIALVPVFIFLIIARSKTSLNLTFLGLFVISYFALSERFGPRFIFATISTGLLLAAGVLAILAVREFDLTGFLGATTGDASFSGRDELWAFARQEAKTRYWFGHGYGAFWDVGLVNDPLTRTEPGSWLSEVKVGVINQAHDGYLELWLNAGLPITVLATMIIVFGALSGAYKTVFGRGSRQVRAAFGGLTVLLTLHLLHNLTEATLFLRGANYHTTALLALFLLARSRYFTSGNERK